jgi:hypothetical protein
MYEKRTVRSGAQREPCADARARVDEQRESGREARLQGAKRMQGTRRMLDRQELVQGSQRLQGSGRLQDELSLSE